MVKQFALVVLAFGLALTLTFASFYPSVGQSFLLPSSEGTKTVPMLQVAASSSIDPWGIA
jgi:hypothetical protein